MIIANPVILAPAQLTCIAGLLHGEFLIDDNIRTRALADGISAILQRMVKTRSTRYGRLLRKLYERF